MVEEQQIKIPDIGGAEGVDVIEILVKEGDTIQQDTSLITLESDKASMEIPSPSAGKVKKLLVKVGDKVSEGDDILVVEGESNEIKELEKNISEPSATAEVQTMQPEVQVQKRQRSEVNTKIELPVQPAVLEHPKAGEKSIYAGPAVRRMANELGVNLSQIKGTGRKGRITKEDLTSFVKAVMETGGKSGGFQIPIAPSIDFSQFGDIEIKPLNKIKRLTGEYVHRSWVTIPHVTQFDEADITELEAFRKAEKEAAKKAGYNLTLLAFVTKALCQSLKTFPQFNASLSSNGQDLIYKSYYNIGIAVDTPNGLVVPVIKEVDQLSVAEIAKEMSRLSQKAREKGLMPNDMSGGCMTISSLGGIGGTSFTPIVNGPEVAILGLSRSYIKPVYQQENFVPRLMLPLSLSYDHRVIDGAEAAQFTVYLADLLSDIRKIILG